MKNLKIIYGDSIFALPSKSLMAAISKAGEFQLKVLLTVAANEALRLDYDSSKEKLCEMLDCTKTALGKALGFWIDAGVIGVSEGDCSNIAAESKKEKEHNKKLLLKAQLPTYTEGEAADIIENSGDLKDAIDMCQQLLGKIFTPAEVQIIVSFYDYLKLPSEYIAMLVAYCSKIGKSSMRYIEKTAIGLFDEGINTKEALEEYIKRRESYDDKLKQIREITGIGSRTLSANEAKYFECWTETWKFDIEVIHKAYDITVDKLGEWKAAYMNKILHNWYNDSLNTIEAIEEKLLAYKQKRDEANQSKSSFDTDEFFEAALKRSQNYHDNN